MKPRFAFAVPAAVATACVAFDALARPGGGHTYSGGGHDSGGGGGGGGDGGLIFFFVRLLLDLCIEAPAIGIPLVLAIAIGFMVAAARQKTNRDWDGPSQAAVVASRAGTVRRGESLGAIAGRDPEFSPIFFEDFVYALFAAAQRARHDPKKLGELAPYLDDAVRRALLSRAAQGTYVTAVVVGALRLSGVELSDAEARVTVELEANLILGGATSNAEYVVERWTLHRGANVRSRPWAEAKKFVCPNCGAPFESTDSARCKFCGEVVSNGRFDWSVSNTTLVRSDARPPNLRGTVPEQGTDLATIRDADFSNAWERLRTEDPALTEQALASRVELIHREMTRAWNERNLAPARGFVSDGLFDYLGYWVQAYGAQGLRNVVDEARIVRFEPVKLVRDRHYDALTARLFATGKDYTMDQRGEVVGGSRTRNRDYSEYWTLIRGAETRGAPRAESTCPNCGAELHVEMSGECSYCRVRVTTGRFDWVLSKIEQDDSYAG